MDASHANASMLAETDAAELAGARSHGRRHLHDTIAMFEAQAYIEWLQAVYVLALKFTVI